MSEPDARQCSRGEHIRPGVFSISWAVAHPLHFLHFIGSLYSSYLD